MNSLWMTLGRTPGTSRVTWAVMRTRPSCADLEETYVFGKRTMVPIPCPTATQSILSPGCAEASHSLYRYVHLHYLLSSCTLISLILVIPLHVALYCNFSSRHEAALGKNIAVFIALDHSATLDPTIFLSPQLRTRSSPGTKATTHKVPYCHLHLTSPPHISGS